MASGEWQWNRTHEIDMQTGPRGVGHIDFTAVAVDPEEFAVSDQALSDVGLMATFSVPDFSLLPVKSAEYRGISAISRGGLRSLPCGIRAREFNRRRGLGNGLGRGEAL